MIQHSPSEPQHRLRLIAAGIILLFAVSIAATVLLTPAYSLPVGTAIAEGDSMGDEGPQAIVYADAGEISTGDVVVFEAGGEYLQHRVVGESDLGYVTKGDANPTMDQPGYPHATEENIRGVTIATVPLGVVQGSILALLALFGLSGAWLYRRRLIASLRLNCEWRTRLRERLRKLGAIAFSLLLVSSMIAGVAIIGTQPLDSGQSGTAAASHNSGGFHLNGTYDGHSDWARDAHWRSDGYLYTGAYDNEVHKVDPSDMTNTSIYTGHTDSIMAIDSDSSGNLYTAANDNSVHKVDASTMSQVATFTAPNNQVLDVVVGNDGYVYAADRDGIVHKVDPSDMTRVDYYSGHADAVAGVDMGPNGNLFTGSWDNTVHKVDTSDMSQVTTYSGHSNSVQALYVGNDGYVYTGSDDTEVHKLDPSDLSQVGTYTAPTGTVWSITMGDDGFLYPGTGSMVARVDPSDMTEKATYSGDSTSVYGVSTDPDGYVYAARAGTQVEKLDPGTSIGQPLEGYVTDSDGNALDATLTLEQSGSQVATTTTNASGGYRFDSVEDGSYDLTAESTGYVSDTKSISVSGSPVRQDFQLKELSVGGQVVGCEITDPRCENPDPVAHATVEVWGVNHTAVEEQFDGVTSAAEAEEKAKEIRQEAETIEPPEWNSDLEFLGEGGEMSTAENPYVAVHAESQWGLTGYTDSPDLRPPRLKAEPGETIVLSAWDPAEEDLTQDGVNKQLPGETMDGETIVVEQLGPGKGEVMDRREYELDASREGYEVGVIRPNRHAFVKTQLPEGYYRVRVEGSQASYVIKVGDPFVGIVNDLRDQAGNLVDKSQQIREWQDQRILQRKAVTTDENGRWAINFSHDGVKTIGAYAYKADGRLDPTSSRSMLEQVRDARAQQGYNGSVYVPREPIHADVPSSGVQLRTTKLSAEPFADLEGLSDRMLAQLAEFLDSTPSELRDIWNVPSGEWDGIVDDPTGGVGGDTGSDTANDATQYLQDRYRQMVALAEETGAVDDDAPEWWSERDDVPESRDVLLKRIGYLQDQIEYQDPGSQPDPEPPGTSNGELQAIFPFNGEVDPETVNVQVEWADGTISPINDSYYSVESTLNPMNGDRVVIEGYPIPEGKTVGDIHVDAAVDDSAVSSRRGFRNPAYQGDVPAFRSIDVSTTHPGPDDTVTVRPRARPGTGYGEVVDVNVYGPDGAVSSSVSQNNETAQFTTNGAGEYTVELHYESQGGQPFTERFTLTAGDQSASIPPTVKAQTSVGGGHYALAGSGIRDASIDADQTSRRTRVTAVVPADGSINQLHVQVRSAIQGDKLNVRVVQGTDERTVRNHVAVVIHEDLSDDALVWRDDRQPITRDGATRFGDIEEREDGKHLIRTYTNARGQLDATIKQDPGYVDRAAHGVWSSSAAQTIRSINLPGPLSIVGPAVDAAAAWLGGLPAPLQVGGPPIAAGSVGVAVAGRVSS